MSMSDRLIYGGPEPSKAEGPPLRVATPHPWTEDCRVACTVDLGPLVRLQKQLWRGAFFTGLGVYLEAILAFVLATEQSLSLAAVVIIIAILVAQLTLVYHPARLLLRGELVRRYRIYLALVGAFVLVVSFGSPAGQARVVATVMAIFVTSLTAWAPVTDDPGGGVAGSAAAGSS